jgi:carboxylesterase
VAAQLPKVAVPLLLFRSQDDHVVHPSNSELILTRISSTDVHEIVLRDSYHVATLDNDAPAVFAGSVEFIRRLSGAAGAGEEPGAGTVVSGSEAGSAEALT